MPVSPPRVFWIGGSPCAGKSSIGRLLGERHDMHVYSLDDHFEEHLRRATEARSPRLVAARTTTPNDIWSQPVPDLLRDELAFYDEEFPLTLADVTRASLDRRVVAEGTGMLPHLLAPLLGRPVNAIWLVPTPEFQLHHYSRRDWIHGILEQCDDPATAFAHWMGRDAGFASHVAAEAGRLRLPLVVVDGSRSLHEVLTEVESVLVASDV